VISIPTFTQKYKDFLDELMAEDEDEDEEYEEES
jgi:hypothetical protein